MFHHLFFSATSLQAQHDSSGPGRPPVQVSLRQRWLARPVPNSYVYQCSQLAPVVEGPLFRSPLHVISGTAVPPLILCDQAFPPHAEQLSEVEEPYNHDLSRSMCTVENVFGRMKAHLRFIPKRMECDLNNVPLTSTCATNILAAQFCRSGIAAVEASDVAYEQPAHSTNVVEGSGETPSESSCC